MLKFLILFFSLSLTTLAQNPLQESKRINGVYVKQALQSKVKDKFASVVKILVEDEHISSGTIIEANGLIITKTSELPEEFLIQFNDEAIHRATIISNDSETDLTLLKINATNLQAIDFTDTIKTSQADWLVNILPSNTVKIGLVSAKQRNIIKVSGVLGVLLGIGDDKGVIVNQAINDGPAHLSGIKSGDIIKAINDQKTLSRDAVLKALEGKGPGKSVAMTIFRNGRTLNKDIILGDRHVTFGMFNRNLEMSGTISKRIDGFKSIIQHDTAISHNETGTPVCNIDGKVVSLNIAKVNRSETFALPNSEVLNAIKRLKAKIPKSLGNSSTSLTESFDSLIKVQNSLKTILPQSQKVTVGLLVNGASGSGVLISEDGYILTAAHISDAPKTLVKVFYDEEKSFDAVSLGIHPKADLGLIKILNTDKIKFPFAKLAKSQLHKVGDWCFGLGHPNGYSIERGPVLRIGKLIDIRPHLIWTDCTLLGGDSGGPLFNLNGEVIGIHSRIFESSDENIHGPADIVLNNWQELIAGKVIDNKNIPPFLGIITKGNGIGVKVTQVVELSSASRAGIQKGDIILSIDRSPIMNTSELIKVIKDKSVGDEVLLNLTRDGDEMQIKATLGLKP